MFGVAGEIQKVAGAKLGRRGGGWSKFCLPHFEKLPANFATNNCMFLLTSTVRLLFDERRFLFLNFNVNKSTLLKQYNDWRVVKGLCVTRDEGKN